MQRLKFLFLLLLVFFTVTASTANKNATTLSHDYDAHFKESYKRSAGRSRVTAELAKELESEVLIESQDSIAKGMQHDALSLVTRYVGVGYDLIKGSPEGEFNGGGGDPGIKITQTKEQQAYSGAKSYQRDLSHSVKAGLNLPIPIKIPLMLQFSGSMAMKSASQETVISKKVIVDQKKICSYGNARYIDNNGILSNEFLGAVKELPMNYRRKEEKLAYLHFVQNWGTDIIMEAELGTKRIERFKSSYKDTLKLLINEDSLSVNAGISILGFGASVGIDVRALNKVNLKKSKFSQKSQRLVIGKKYPYPIKISLKPISEALKPYECLQIKNKRVNLMKARRDYAKKFGKKLEDPNIRVELSWPSGTYALPETTSGCPTHEFSEGCRYQDSEDSKNKNRVRDTDVLRAAFSRNMEMCYCVKHDTGKSDFTWPAGTYCIAKKGTKPDENFRKGMIKWDDENKWNWNKKPALLRLPDGKYDKNTIVDYWCRSDGDPEHPILLPTKVPFVLYQYKSKGCQSVLGMSVRRIMIDYDDENRRNSDKCSGFHPYNDKCSNGQRLHLCYYYSRNQRLQEYQLTGTFQFKCASDPGPSYEAYGYLIIEFAGKRYEVWQSKRKVVRNNRYYRKDFTLTFKTATELKDLNVRLYGKVKEDDWTRDDIIGVYDKEKISAKTILDNNRTFTYSKGKNHVKISLRLLRRK